MRSDHTDTTYGPAEGADLVDVHEAAELLGVGPSTINRWVREGRLGYVVDRRRRLYDRRTLNRPAPAPGSAPSVVSVWTTGQVASRLQVSHALVRRLAHGESLRSTTSQRGRLRFARADVEQFVADLDIDPHDAVPLSRAATVLGVSARTIKRWSADGSITIYRGLAGGGCVHREELETLAHARGFRPLESRDPNQLTTHDVAVMLGRSEEWVRQRANAGAIVSRRTTGGRRRFRLTDLPRTL